LFIYLRAKLNSQWQITESAQTKTTGRHTSQNKQKKQKNKEK
jgi:hypothetical protein